MDENIPVLIWMHYLNAGGYNEKNTICIPH